MAVPLEKAIVVKLEKLGKTFEVLADPDGVLDLREGKKVNVRDILAIDEIFKDARKGERASEEDIMKVFGTTDIEKVAEIIIKEGEFRPTAEQRRKMLERIRKQIIELIARNSVDPRTNLPHPRERIENALEQAKVKIDLRPAAEQINEVVKALRPILPLKFGTVKLQLIIPMKYANSVYGKVKREAKVLREQWSSSGVILWVEVPSGMKVEFMEMIANLTRGEAGVKEVE